MTRVGFGNVCHALNVITIVDSVQHRKSDKIYFFLIHRSFFNSQRLDNERRRREINSTLCTFTNQ